MVKSLYCGLCHWLLNTVAAPPLTREWNLMVYKTHSYVFFILISISFRDRHNTEM